MIPLRPPAITVESPVLKTTTFKELIPPAEAAQLRKEPRPDYWEFVRSIPESEIGDYMIILSREDPGKVHVDSTTSKFWDVPGYGPIWIADQEGLEMAVARVCGGGGYRLALKRRKTSEWVCDVRFRIDLPPKQLTPWYFNRPLSGQSEQNPNSNGNIRPSDPTTQIATRAMEMVAGQEHAAMNIGIDLFRAAGEVLKHPAQNPLGDELMRSLLARAINPPAQPDPIELLTRVMTLQERVNPAGNNGGNPIMNRILDVAVTRLLEPVNVSPAVSAGAEIVRSLPSIAGQFVEGIREWRLGKEAERDSVIAMQQPPQPPTQRGQPPPSVATPPILRPATPLPSVNPAVGGIVPPSTEFVESRIVQIFQAPISAQEAAERALEFLYTLDGENTPPEQSYVENLARMGETGLAQLFQARPILKVATANTPRLLDFIHAFLRVYQEDKKADEENAAGKPN